jgi:porphyrinogen peroxidase
VTADVRVTAAGEPQAVLSPLTGAAIFLVAVVNPGRDSADAVRDLCADVGALVRAVGFRDQDTHLTCVVGLGADAWDRLAGSPRPAGLHPFREIHAGTRHAVATPGDLLFHIRAGRMDICFELATQIMARLEESVTIVDEVHGFRYFDDRDLLGFVDGTENPTGQAALEATIIPPGAYREAGTSGAAGSAVDAAFAGGSYVIVQKYLHDLDTWNALSTQDQENAVGRTKLTDIELDDAVKPSYAHNALTTIVEDGVEVQIVRDNMPFGEVGAAEYGTYFIGYSRRPDVIEQMLVNMFVGSPEGNYDRLLDVSRAVTGSLFFVPSLPLLESLADFDPASGPEPVTEPAAEPDPEPEIGAADSKSAGSLNIGSLKGTSQDE